MARAADRAALRDALFAAPMQAVGLAPRASEPPVGQWSAREIVLHLAAVDEVVWQPRLDSLAGREPPTWLWVEPQLWAGPGDDTLDGALMAFRDRRAATLARIDDLDEDGWRREGVHSTFGRLDVAALLRILIDHDEEHLAQLGAMIGSR